MYEEYALLCIQEKELKKRKENLNEMIVAEMVKSKQEKQKHSLGNFTLSMLKKWKYPKYINELAEDLKAKKAKAESTGEAKYDEEPSLRFTPTTI